MSVEIPSQLIYFSLLPPLASSLRAPSILFSPIAKVSDRIRGRIADKAATEMTRWKRTCIPRGSARLLNEARKYCGNDVEKLERATATDDGGGREGEVYWLCLSFSRKTARRPTLAAPFIDFSAPSIPDITAVIRRKLARSARGNW